MNMAHNNKTLFILTWFSVTITLQPVMAVAACNVNFVNVLMIAYRVHVYARASLIHSANPNPESSNRISPKIKEQYGALVSINLVSVFLYKKTHLLTPLSHYFLCWFVSRIIDKSLSLQQVFLIKVTRLPNHNHHHHHHTCRHEYAGRYDGVQTIGITLSFSETWRLVSWRRSHCRQWQSFTLPSYKEQ